jgi:hypothetical protein
LFNEAAIGTPDYVDGLVECRGMWDLLGALLGFLDRRLARPRLGAHFDWIEQSGSPILRFFFINNGRRRTTIAEVRFGTAGTPVTEGWTRQQAILNQLPQTLDPHTATQPFYLTTDSPTEEFDQLLGTGKITSCVVETTERRRHTKTFRVPAPPG